MSRDVHAIRARRRLGWDPTWVPTVTEVGPRVALTAATLLSR